MVDQYFFPGNVELLEFRKKGMRGKRPYRKRKPMSAATKKKISLALMGVGGVASVGLGAHLYNNSKKVRIKSYDKKGYEEKKVYDVDLTKSGFDLKDGTTKIKTMPLYRRSSKPFKRGQELAKKKKRTRDENSELVRLRRQQLDATVYENVGGDLPSYIAHKTESKKKKDLVNRMQFLPRNYNDVASKVLRSNKLYFSKNV